MLRSAMAFLLVPVKDCLRAGDLVHLVPGQVQTILGIHFWMEVEGTLRTVDRLKVNQESCWREQCQFPF